MSTSLGVILLVLFVVDFKSSNCGNLDTINSDRSNCTASKFAFRLSNTDIKINKCHHINDLNDMVWTSGCNKNNNCINNEKHAFMTIEAINNEYMLWPHGMDEIFMTAFNKLVLHYNRYSLLERPYKMFFMSTRQKNGAKYIHSNNMHYGAIHMTLKYLCCYTEKELQQIMELLLKFEWDSFQLTLKKMICLYDMDSNKIHFPFIFDTQSQILLKKWTFQFEQFMDANNIKVKQCRKDFEPFHTSFISIKYGRNKLEYNKENILNNAVTYINDINNNLFRNDYDLTIWFDKETILYNFFIAAKNNDVFEFNNLSYIGIA